MWRRCCSVTLLLATAVAGLRLGPTAAVGGHAAGLQLPQPARGRSPPCRAVAGAATLSSTKLREQLAAGTLLLDRRDWGTLTLTGGDRRRFMHQQSTQEIEACADNAVVDCALTTAGGKMRDLVTCAVLPSQLRLLCAPGCAAEIGKRMSMFIFPLDDVEVSVDAEVAVLSVVGAGSEKVLRSAGLQMPPKSGACLVELTLSTTSPPYTLDVSVLLLDGAGLAAPGVTMILPASAAEEMASRLSNAEGVWRCGAEEYNLLSLLDGRPMAPELSKEYGPLEAGLRHAVSFDKGCYIGQETISRMKDGKAVRRRLLGMQLSAEAPAGTELYKAKPETDGEGGLPTRPAAVLTRSIATQEGVVGMAYVRRNDASVGSTLVSADGALTATVTELPLTAYTEPEPEVEASASPCTLSDRGGCNARELEFIAKWEGKPAPMLSMQVEMLQGMKATAKMKPDIAAWLETRLQLLAQMQEAA